VIAGINLIQPHSRTCGERAIRASRGKPVHHLVFFGTALWLGLPGRAVEANGEAVGTTFVLFVLFVLFAFGFFFSRLLLFWPFATVSPYDDADAAMRTVRDASFQNSVIHPTHSATRHGRRARILLRTFGNHRFRCYQEASDRTRVL
jgi:hypothetical protein